MEEQQRLTNQDHIDLWEEEIVRWRSRSSGGEMIILIPLCLLCVAFGLVVLLYGISLAAA